MRVASRIVGVVLALAGLGFISLVRFSGRLWLRPQVRSVGASDRSSWIAGSVGAAALGVGFLLAGRYFLKLDVDALDETEERPASRFAPYFIAHRRELKLIAQVDS